MVKSLILFLFSLLLMAEPCTLKPAVPEMFVWFDHLFNTPGVNKLGICLFC